MIAAPSLYTERLELRAHIKEDFDKLRELYASDRSRYIGGPLAARIVWQNFTSTVGQWPLLGIGAWAICLRATGEFIGQVGISLPLDYPEPELGWLLFDGFEGSGYALEGALKAKQYALETGELQSLVSYIDPDNTPSIKLAHKLGAVRDAHAPTPNNDPCLVFRFQ